MQSLIVVVMMMSSVCDDIMMTSLAIVMPFACADNNDVTGVSFVSYVDLG